jgi:hypothetical protein
MIIGCLWNYSRHPVLEGLLLAYRELMAQAMEA